MSIIRPMVIVLKRYGWGLVMPFLVVFCELYKAGLHTKGFLGWTPLAMLFVVAFEFFAIGYLYCSQQELSTEGSKP